MTYVGWYNTGTVSVTGSNATVTGSGTSFLANALPGLGFQGPDGRLYQILTVDSDTSLTIQPSYIGSTASGQAYGIVPIQGFQVNLASQVAAQAAAVQAYTALAPAANDFLMFAGSPVVPLNKTPVQAFATLTSNLTEVTVSSASTADIGAAASPKVQISGTTTITSFGSSTNCLRWVRFSGTLTLTHNGTSLILPGAANITTAAGDTAEFASDTSGNWRCRQYQRASGLPISLVSPTITGTLTAAGANFSDVVSFSLQTKVKGDTNSLLFQNSTPTAVALLGTVKAWLGTGSNVTDFAIGANGAFNVYTGGGSTAAFSVASSGAATFGGNIQVSLSDPTIDIHATNTSTSFGLKMSASSNTLASDLMNASTGELRHSVGFSAFGGFHTWYVDGAARAKLANDGSFLVGTTTATGPGTIGTQVYTVSTLPTGAKGARSFVSDATSSTFNAAAVGSGSNNVPVFHDGTGWKVG